MYKTVVTARRTVSASFRKIRELRLRKMICGFLVVHLPVHVEYHPSISLNFNENFINESDVDFSLEEFQERQFSLGV